MGKVAPVAGLAAVVLTAGCVHPQDPVDFEVDTTPRAAPEPVVVRDVEIGADDDDAAAPGTPSAAPAVVVWSAVPLKEHEPVLFRLGAGLGALGHIDLNPCRDQGLPPGYVHMHLTFRRNGRVVRAAVETPTAPAPEALACVADEIEATMVPEFDGEDVMLSRSFFVN